ncbi:hypothetical protein HPC49_41130 [Pyxidicoccus fallax]|uniref:Uncharacterized protein n=1 Tax=Pyxidicoccus fallax TaxID=394095 RepID=A0A848LJ41_9BACT|nr:hypothetical protein [Pyxidicoccus fallax]NMO17739.1 hypothetical protein [Pyxidicoccus fallax]NPC84606.1 hypothetical protein [Pyxidicoccus fallax]
MDGSGPHFQAVVCPDVDVSVRVRTALGHEFPHFHPVTRGVLSTLVWSCDGLRRLFPPRRASDVVPELTAWEQFLSTEPRSRRIAMSVQPLGVDTTGGTWVSALLARLTRWLRDNRKRGHNQPTDVWVARLGREGFDARQPVEDPSVLTVAVTQEGGGLRVARLPLDAAALTPGDVARLLAAAPVRTRAELRRDGPRPQVVVDLASRGGGAWTSHLLASSAWLGARVDGTTGSLELSFDHLVLDGTAMLDVSRALAGELPRRAGGGDVGEWLTGPGDATPLLRVELPERLDFRNLCCAMLTALERTGAGLLPLCENPTLLAPVLPDAPASVERDWRRISIAVVPSRTREGPVTPEQVSAVLARTRRRSGVLEGVLSALYTPALPWCVSALTTYALSYTPVLRQIAATMGGNALLSKLTLVVDDEAALAAHPPLFFNTIRPISAVGGGVALCVTEVLCVTPSGTRKRFFAALAGSGLFNSRERLLAFRAALAPEAARRARPPLPTAP